MASTPATWRQREAVEETGYKVDDVQHAFDTYTSPGGVTELIHCFVAAYTPEMKVSKGGGLPEEGEKIELLEPTLDAALHMMILEHTGWQDHHAAAICKTAQPGVTENQK
jgi:8-oxo-dGTP pyrophosphatase MutT (NUDIX family)